MANLDLPQSVLDLVELSPIEDVALYILREGLPDVPIHSLIEEDPPENFILVRRDHTLGAWDGDTRFVDAGMLAVQVFTSDPDGDEKGALLSEAVRVVLRNAWLGNMKIPGHGWLVSAQMTTAPHRVTDWATATGPVQYADLPNGRWRYESKYHIAVRKPR